jgi:transcription-repair coupling factor (superfamily II helicase)
MQFGAQISSKNSIVAPVAANPFVIATIAKKQSVLVVTPNARIADKLIKELAAFNLKILNFPAWETLPHEKLKPSSETIAKRISTLNELRSNEKVVVIAPVRSAIHEFSKDLAATEPLSVAPGRKLEISDFAKKLVNLSYERTDLVESRGDFAIRGGIIDLFPPQLEHPIRIDMFDDEIESIHTFAITDQRSIEGVTDLIEILPCKELPTDQNGQLIVERLPKNSKTIFIERDRCASRVAELLSTDEEFRNAAWSNASIGADAPNEVVVSEYLEFKEIEKRSHDVLNLKPYGNDLSEDLFLEIDPAPVFNGKLEELTKFLLNKKTFFVANTTGTFERYRNMFRDLEIEIPMELLPIENGFSSSGLTFITESDFIGSSTSNSEKLPSKRKKRIDPLELKPGDYVVHEQHGIGTYVELLKRKVAGIEREYLVIEYALAKRGQPGDRIYVPTDSLDLISKYIGGERPAINRIGSGEWSKAKSRARKAVKQIAGELIRLYAARKSEPGFAFSPDTTWQKELEASFPFVETDDQLSTIEDVKRDMEDSFPMDRLVCGDVGYGKTEIAIRAAFKATQDGKQVAVLVPTTLLVQQHLKTFSQRYANFPIKVAGLSRFNTIKERKEILKELETGSIDVLIGTHRILSQDVKFRDLGLVIIDEEQRFGVEQKEELKKLRVRVDVLAMSATPIPRTLEMAITGIREMSTISTPPEERHPVLTYVGPSDPNQIKAAIHRELMRDGQIFYIHNRVESIDRAALKLQEIIPEARIRVAHGQMSESALEDVIIDFWNRKFDVLVCTTIIESGLDISNANTLIVERADLFGLSQLHQIRGRVGRSKERGYAYFLYDADKPLSEIAIERLNTIASNTELGSGMQVALKDLEIRGAGNLLGGEQSGHIAEVGFDLYMRMVGEAVAEFKSGIVQGEAQDKDCRIELAVNAHLPETYIESERLRLDIYRRLADIKNENEIGEFSAELTDRFGPIPEPVKLLLQIAKLRYRAKKLGLNEILMQGNKLRISPVKLPESKVIKLDRLYPRSIYKSASNVALVAFPQDFSRILGETTDLVDTSLIEWVTKIMDELIEG